MAVAAPAESLAFTSGRRKAVFFGVLALVTALPLFGLGLVLPMANPAGTQFAGMLAGMFPIIAATGVGHVASTAFLYMDRGFWPLMRQNRGRFFLWPLLAVGVFLGAFAISPVAAVAFNLAFAAWQLHHYQRQNYGVIAFAAQDRKVGKLPETLRLVLDLGTAGGVCGLISNVGFATGPAAQDHAMLLGLRFCGMGFFAASTVVLAYLLVTSRRLRADPLVLGFTLLGWAFFLPVLMSRDILVCVQSFAIGHGAQYLVFLAIISGGSRFRWVGPVVMAGVTFVTWKLFTLLSASPAGAAAYTGLVAGHFMVDAKVWRMRDPLQRSLIRERFGFLFA